MHGDVHDRDGDAQGLWGVQVSDVGTIPVLHGIAPEMLLAAAQTIGLVAYARQHMPRINGLWVFPVCLIVAFLVCFAGASGFDVAFAQRSVAVSMLAFGAMVLRRGGNGSLDPLRHVDDDGPPPSPPPPSRSSFTPETSPVTSALMHVIPFVLLAVLFAPIIAKLIR
jgi:hypothetical protein